MLLPQKWLRTRRQFMYTYWLTQTIIAYFLSLAIMTPFSSEDTDTWIMWLAPFAITILILTLQWLLLRPIKNPATKPPVPTPANSNNISTPSAKTTKRPLIISLMVAALLIGVLLVAIILAVGHTLHVLSLLDLGDLDLPTIIIVSLCVIAACWLISTPLLIVFSRQQVKKSKPNQPDAILKKVASAIFLGTIIEAAAIIPLDALVRRNDDSCICQNGTYFGLILCLAVGLLTFGPAIFLPLITPHRKRWYGKHCEVCNYDMRGNMNATKCPECGTGWKI